MTKLLGTSINLSPDGISSEGSTANDSRQLDTVLPSDIPFSFTHTDTDNFNLVLTTNIAALEQLDDDEFWDEPFDSNYSLNIITLTSGLTLVTHYMRVTNDRTSDYLDRVVNASITTTGIHTSTNVSWVSIDDDKFGFTPAAIDDQFGFSFEGQQPGGMPTSRTLTISVNDPDTYVDVLTFNPPSVNPTISCQLITAPATLLNSTIVRMERIFPPAINVAATVLEPTVLLTQTLEVQTIVTATTVFQPTLKHDIILPAIVTTTNLFDPNTVAKILLDFVTAPSTILNPDISVTQIVEADVLITTATVHSPTLNQDLILNVLNTITSLFAPTTRHDVVLNIVNVPENVLQPATDTTTNIDAQLITATPTVQSPGLDQDISMPMVPVAENVLSPRAQVPQDFVEFQLVTDEATLLTPEVTTNNTVQADLITSPAIVNSPSTVYVIELQTVATDSTIFSPTVESVILLPVFNTSPTVNAPLIGDPPEPSEATGAIVKTHNPSPFPIGL